MLVTVMIDQRFKLPNFQRIYQCSIKQSNDGPRRNVIQCALHILVSNAQCALNCLLWFLRQQKSTFFFSISSVGFFFGKILFSCFQMTNNWKNILSVDLRDFQPEICHQSAPIPATEMVPSWLYFRPINQSSTVMWVKLIINNVHILPILFLQPQQVTPSLPPRGTQGLPRIWRLCRDDSSVRPTQRIKTRTQSHTRAIRKRLRA